MLLQLTTTLKNKKEKQEECHIFLYPFGGVEYIFSELCVAGFELHAIWSETTVGSSLDMAELENASPLEAEKWLISPNLSEAL